LPRQTQAHEQQARDGDVNGSLQRRRHQLRPEPFEAGAGHDAVLHPEDHQPTEVDHPGPRLRQRRPLRQEIQAQQQHEEHQYALPKNASEDTQDRKYLRRSAVAGCG